MDVLQRIEEIHERLATVARANGIGPADFNIAVLSNAGGFLDNLRDEHIRSGKPVPEELEAAMGFILKLTLELCGYGVVPGSVK